MPIYEYECMNCGQHCEVMQKFSAEPLSTCTACSGPLHKLVSHTLFVLKGSGWYVTDYASPAVGGVAVNVAFWALNRAWWANETLRSLGVRG